MSFLAELRRRNVIRMAGLYVVGAWLIVQVAETLLPAFDIPAWVLRAIIILLAIGLVPTLVFSWIYELTPEGLKRDHEVEPSQSITAETAKRLDLLTLAAIALLLLVTAADRWWPQQNEPAQRPADTAEAPAAPQDAGVSRNDAASPPEQNGAQSDVSQRSVAVLPFVNMSADPEQEYFSDGISEELLNRLAQIPDLQVAARTSAFQFKGKNLDIGDIGRQLRVAHVLEGSVRKAGIKLRITAQLIDSRSGYHLWSETYDRDATDVFLVQDEIAGEIARALKTKLGVVSEKTTTAIQADPQAFDDYLLGRSYIAKRFKENLQLAIEAFDRAIAQDPDFAAAHSGRAFAHLLMPMWGSGSQPHHAREAHASAERALALDPDHAEALMVRGMVAFFGYRARQARADLERAYALAPGAVNILNLYGDFLNSSGASVRAEQIKREAMLRDPLALVHPLNLADIMLTLGRPAEAPKFAEQAKALGAGTFALDRLVQAYKRLGQPGEAAKAAEEGCALDAPIDRICSANRALVLSAEGRTDAASALLSETGARMIREGRAEDEGLIENLASYFLEIGDIASATRYQQRCLDSACWFVTNTLIFSPTGAALPEEISDDPDWLAVWADPRIEEVMQEFRSNLAQWRADRR